jgi:hypothetical protein
VTTGRHLRIHHNSFSSMHGSSCSLLGTPSSSKSPKSSLAFAQGLRRGRIAAAGASRSNLLCGGSGNRGAVRAVPQIYSEGMLLLDVKNPKDLVGYLYSRQAAPFQTSG